MRHSRPAEYVCIDTTPVVFDVDEVRPRPRCNNSSVYSSLLGVGGHGGTRARVSLGVHTTQDAWLHTHYPSGLCKLGTLQKPCERRGDRRRAWCGALARGASMANKRVPYDVNRLVDVDESTAWYAPRYENCARDVSRYLRHDTAVLFGAQRRSLCPLAQWQPLL